MPEARLPVALRENEPDVPKAPSTIPDSKEAERRGMVVIGKLLEGRHIASFRGSIA